MFNAISQLDLLDKFMCVHEPKTNKLTPPDLIKTKINTYMLQANSCFNIIDLLSPHLDKHNILKEESLDKALPASLKDIPFLIKLNKNMIVPIRKTDLNIGYLKDDCLISLFNIRQVLRAHPNKESGVMVNYVNSLVDQLISSRGIPPYLPALINSFTNTYLTYLEKHPSIKQKELQVI